jgi:topoisomerase-4 subunit A
MATDIPPHNLREVVRRCIRLLEQPKATLDDLCAHRGVRTSRPAAEIITPRDDICERCTRPATAACACAPVGGRTARS